MKIEDSFVVAAPQARVWSFITDPQKIGPCIPGCQGIEVTGPNSYKASVRVEIGPIKADFKLQVDVEEEVPPSHARSVTRGEEGGRASLLTAQNLLKLETVDGESTKVTYSSEISLVGRLSKFGFGVMKKKAKSLGDQLAQSLQERLAVDGGA